MTENRLFAGWLRSITVLAAVAGTLGLSACGGGSGAPNNPFLGTLTVQPTATVAYSGVPTSLTISGGTGPYRAFSSNSAVLPVPQTVPGTTVVLLATNVAADTEVTITIQETGTVTPNGAQTPVTVTVRAAPLVNSLTIVPNNAECGTTAICSGQTGTAAVNVLGPQGGPLAGRQVRFDVVSGPYGITTTNPAQPIVASLTVISDASGLASVIIKANVSAPTQFAQLRATDLTSGQQLTGNFLIQQITNGSTILTVVPNTAKITAAFKGECSSGFRTDYYIYGGTPPYRVTSSFPSSITVINPVVNADGGFFEAITNGSCVDPLTFSILDFTGRQTTATLSNVEGTTDRTTTPPPALGVSPASYLPDTACTGKTFPFTVFGGTPPYNVSASKGIVSPQILTKAGAPPATVSGLLTGSGVTSVLFLDSSLPQKSATATITCDDPTTPPSAALSVTPASYTSNACTGTPFAFAAFGGTPPYNVSPTRGTATPAVIGSSGGLTTITGLVTGTGPASVLFLDQSLPQKSFTVSIACDPAPAPTPTPPPPALVVTAGFDYSTSTCVGQTSNFAVTGGTPPYSVAFSAPLPPAGTITPSSGLVSGQGYSVTGLVDLFGPAPPSPPAPVGTPGPALPYIAYLTTTDAGTPVPQQVVRSIICP